MLFSGIAMPALVTDDERRRRDKRHHLAASNVATLLLASLRSLPAYTDSRCVRVCSLHSHHNIPVSSTLCVFASFIRVSQKASVRGSDHAIIDSKQLVSIVVYDHVQKYEVAAVLARATAVTLITVFLLTHTN
jgi:hypothetical protein